MTGVTVSTVTDPQPGSERSWPWLHALIRVAGAAVALAGGVLVGVLTLLMVPLRLDLGFWEVRFPVAVVLAIAGNMLLLWFAREATGTRWAVLLPVAGWFVIMLPALGTTTEGSRLLMPNDLVALLALFGGTIVVTIGSVLALVRPRHPVR